MAQNSSTIEYCNKNRVEDKGKTAEVSIDSSRKRVSGSGAISD